MIAVYINQLPGRIRVGSLTDVRVREADDEFIIEAAGHHRSLSDRAAKEISYVWFITRQNGQVTHIRHDMNPLQLSKI